MEIKSKIMGMKQPNASQVIIDELGIGEKVTAVELMNLMKAEWDSEVENIKLLPGAEKLVRHLKANKIPISISTGSSDSSFALKTKHFQEFFDLFDFVVKEWLFHQHFQNQMQVDFSLLKVWIRSGSKKRQTSSRCV